MDCGYNYHHTYCNSGSYARFYGLGGGDLTQPSKFIKEIEGAAREMEGRYGVPAPVIIAQAALESGWGQYDKGNNLFGIKHHGSKDHDYFISGTHEYREGERVPEGAKFRKYDSWAESIEDHSLFLKGNPRYKKCFSAAGPEEFARGLQKAGYATDPNYADKLISIMERYELIREDDSMLGKIIRIPDIISGIVSFFTLIERLVKKAEEDGPSEGGGEEKKGLVLELIEVAYDLLDDFIDIPIDKRKILDAAERVVEIWVKFFNLINVFK